MKPPRPDARRRHRYLLLLPFAALLSVATFSLHSPLDPTDTDSDTGSTSAAATASALDFHALDPAPPLHEAALRAVHAGERLLRDLSATTPPRAAKLPPPQHSRRHCPATVALSGAELRSVGNVVRLPCGLTLGSHVTLVAWPRRAAAGFVVELRGAEVDHEEEAARILHFNPRLRGDWSGHPVIEQNTCFRGQWGAAIRCEGWRSRPDEDTVDGLVKCEQWIGNNDRASDELKRMWLSDSMIGQKNKDSIAWPYPFVESELFVLTLSAGLEGYHVHVDGRHVTSFPYRIGFVLEDATVLSVHGDIDIEIVLVGSLPTSHPSIEQKDLEFLMELKAPPLPNQPVELFIGILSAGSHFAERMAVRRSWMQVVRNSTIAVARFFVALNGREETNAELKKEVDFFGDTVIVPFMDSYDLVVLKTVAICEYAARVVSAKYVMKCDDDTFVRLDSVMAEVKKIPDGKSFYLGNMNYHHKPLRKGKWAVTYEEWPREDYPPYANGPGYVVSSDIASFVVSEMERSRLNLFKMEDVSMGMWVGQFNGSSPVAVEYTHSLRFCQFGCVDGYLTAHYQSPGQMLCLWEKLQRGKPQCCNAR